MANEQEHLEDIKAAIIDGDDDWSAEATQDALDDGVDPLAILNDGLMAGADVVGQKFEQGIFFLPQLMLTGRALKASMALVEPTLQAAYAESGAEEGDTGVVVMATVKTDIHDIGKNIVSSMLTASGFQVHDLGVDVPIKNIITKAQEVNANIIGCSALLTTSMPFMRDLVDLLEAMGERSRFKVMVGGASVTPEFAQKIGADGTAQNAVKAVQLAQRLIREQRAQGVAA
ncbi:MAG: cobalamin B12-binding domain-containing protein [bacterium]